MKVVTTLLIFAAFFCTSRIEASMLNTDDDHSSITSLIQSVCDDIKKAQDELQEDLNEATKQTNQNSIKNPVQSISDNIDKAVKLQKAAEKFNDDIKDAIDNVQESIDKQVKELIKKAESEGVDVSKCSVVDTLLGAVKTILKNTVSCVSGTVGTVTGALKKILTGATGKMEKFQDLEKESKACSKSSRGFLQSLACRNKVKAKESVLTATTVPSLLKGLVLGINDVLSLPTTLLPCVSKKVIGTLLEQVQKLLNSLTQCTVLTPGKKIVQKEKKNKVAVDKYPSYNCPLNCPKKNIF